MTSTDTFNDTRSDFNNNLKPFRDNILKDSVDNKDGNNIINTTNSG